MLSYCSSFQVRSSVQLMTVFVMPTFHRQLFWNIVSVVVLLLIFRWLNDNWQDLPEIDRKCVKWSVEQCLSISMITFSVVVPPFCVIDVDEVSKHHRRPVNTLTVSDSRHSRSQSIVGNPRESRHKPLQEYFGMSTWSLSAPLQKWNIWSFQ